MAQDRFFSPVPPVEDSICAGRLRASARIALWRANPAPPWSDKGRAYVAPRIAAGRGGSKPQAAVCAAPEKLGIDFAPAAARVRACAGFGSDGGEKPLRMDAGERRRGAPR